MTPSESVCLVHNSQHAAGSVQDYKEGKRNKVTPCYLVAAWTTACLAVLTSQSMIQVVAVSSVCGLQPVWQSLHLSL